MIVTLLYHDTKNSKLWHPSKHTCQCIEHMSNKFILTKLTIKRTVNRLIHRSLSLGTVSIPVSILLPILLSNIALLNRPFSALSPSNTNR